MKMRMLKSRLSRVLLSLLLSLSLVLSVGTMTVNAEGEIFSVNITSEGRVKVRGTVGEAGTEVAFIMYVKGTDLNNISGDATNVLMYIDQKTSGNNGEYLFTFTLNDKFAGTEYEFKVGSNAANYTVQTYSGYIDAIPSNISQVSGNSVLVGFDAYNVGISSYNSDNVVESMIRAMKSDPRRLGDKKLSGQRLYYKLGTSDKPMWFDLLDEDATSTDYFKSSNAISMSKINDIYLDRYYTATLMGEYIDYLAQAQTSDFTEILGSQTITLGSNTSYIVDNDTIEHVNQVIKSTDGTATLIFQGKLNVPSGHKLTIKDVNIVLKDNGGQMIKATGDNTSVTIDNCSIITDPSVDYIKNIATASTSTPFVFTLKDSDITGTFRAIATSIGEGSTITNNIIRQPVEEIVQTDGVDSRSGCLSFVGTGTSSSKITVTGNTFEGMNRVIGLDHAKFSADKITIQNNKFINCRYAGEISRSNQLSMLFKFTNNYYIYNGVVGAPKIQDADIANSSNYLTDESMITYDTNVWTMTNPYYTDETLTTTKSDTQP